MKSLILFRHAKSDWPEDVEDFDRPLAQRGLKAAPLMGMWLARKGYQPDLVLVSPARRTRETWYCIEGPTSWKAQVRFEAAIYEATASDLLNLIRAVPPDIGTLMLIGHNPGLQDLAIRLCDGKGRTSLEKLQAKFPTAAAALIRFPMLHHWRDAAEGSAILEDFKTPRGLLD